MPSLPQTFVPFIHELLRSSARPVVPTSNLEVFEPLVAELEVFPRSPIVLRPDGSRRPLDGEPVALGTRRWQLPAFTATDRAGLYRVEVEGESPLPFAVRLEAREGDLDRIPTSELSAMHPALEVSAAGAESKGDETAPAQGELWRGLLICALLALVGESLWAAFLGYKRSRI